VQLCAARHLGAFPEDLTETQPPLWRSSDGS
jgi:hypothetical protein